MLDVSDIILPSLVVSFIVVFCIVFPLLPEFFQRFPCNQIADKVLAQAFAAAERKVVYKRLRAVESVRAGDLCNLGASRRVPPSLTFPAAEMLMGVTPVHTASRIFRAPAWRRPT